jgi:4-amino-4-deoxy-L-arabinose transferase-like glycosyltransferase
MQIKNPIPSRPVLLTAGITLAALAWKVILLGLNAVPFNADEAVVALMARHILQGERPIFFYGQAYMGSLDAFLVAGGFLVFGQQVWVIRWVQALLYAGFIISTIVLGKDILGSWNKGAVAGSLLIVPTVNVSLYTTASLGGYGEALLLGNLILITALRIATYVRKEMTVRPSWGLWFVLGLLAGVGLWANGFTLVFSAPAGLSVLVLFWKNRVKFSPKVWGALFLSAVLGFLAGASPWWVFALSSGFNHLIGELAGGAVAVEQDPFLVRSWNHLVSFLLLGGTVVFGFRPPWEIRWLGLPLLPFSLIFWMLSLTVWFRESFRDKEQMWGRALVNGSLAVLSAGFIFTSFGVDPSGRYFLPFAMPLALAGADVFSRIRVKIPWQIAILGGLVLYQGWGTLDCALRNPPGLTTQFDAVTQVDTHYQSELIDFLRMKGETRGYTNYWVAYPTAFLSNEELIFLPMLPYHEDLRYTARDDRYPPYHQLVTDRAAYITTRNPALDQKLVAEFRRAGVLWQENLIGDYHIFYGLSRFIRPEEMGLGKQP